MLVCYIAFTPPPLLSHGQVSLFQASSKRSQLHEACLAGNITAVRGLVAQHPEQLEMPAAEGETPLYFASMRGHSAIVDLLLKSGASVSSQTRSGNTPLHAAARGGHAEVLKSLLSARANPGALNAFGETAFFVACVQGHTEIASTLSRAGPGAGVPNKANMTPLHIASLCGHKEIVGMLLSMGTPDVNSPDGFNRTPLFLAGAGTHQEVSDAVARAGGKETGQIAPAPAPANPPQPSGSAQPLPWASGAAASASTHAAPALRSLLVLCNLFLGLPGRLRPHMSMHLRQRNRRSIHLGLPNHMRRTHQLPPHSTHSQCSNPLQLAELCPRQRTSRIPSPRLHPLLLLSSVSTARHQASLRLTPKSPSYFGAFLVFLRPTRRRGAAKKQFCRTHFSKSACPTSRR